MIASPTVAGRLSASGTIDRTIKPQFVKERTSSFWLEVLSLLDYLEITLYALFGKAEC